MNVFKRMAISVAVGLVALTVGGGLMFGAMMRELAGSLSIEFRSLITDPDHFGLLSSVAPGRYSFYTEIAVLTGLLAGVVTARLLYRHLGEEVPDSRLRHRPAPPTPPGSTVPVQNSGFHSPGMRPNFQWGGPLAAPLPPDPEPAISGADPTSPRLPISAPGPPRWGSDDPSTKTPPARPRWHWEHESPHPPPPPLQPAPASRATPRASVGPNYRWGNTAAGTSSQKPHPSNRPVPRASISSEYHWDVPSAETPPPESRPDSKPAPRANVRHNYSRGAPATETSSPASEPVPKPVPKPAPRASVGPNYSWGAPTTETTTPDPEPVPKPAPKASVSPDHRWGTHEAGTPRPKTRKPRRPNYRWSS